MLLGVSWAHFPVRGPLGSGARAAYPAVATCNTSPKTSHPIRGPRGVREADAMCARHGVRLVPKFNSAMRIGRPEAPKTVPSRRRFRLAFGAEVRFFMPSMKLRFTSLPGGAALLSVAAGLSAAARADEGMWLYTA